MQIIVGSLELERNHLQQTQQCYIKRYLQQSFSILSIICLRDRYNILCYNKNFTSELFLADSVSKEEKLLRKLTVTLHNQSITSKETQKYSALAKIDAFISQKVH
jgi:hypothetical protein